MPSSSTEEDFSYPWTFIPFQKLNFSIENILNCLRDENVIGKGCSGVVYKAEMPNEYGYTVNITEKSDVYSYGVVLLEILSGRSAVEPQIGDGLHIVWVKKKMEALNRLYQYSTQNSKACRINWCKKCSKLSESLCFV
ncbi:putative LRR receptor-like serine/threonine-protein kinase [Sesamum angolense]|uniref:non-specific serine/threonine protein kinase n=1 Tax=Sesamum angolense TaxID=2727404 RepID=A0AAE1W6N7_9LAMI|nr:putative LRR receptor-like serine/threonine-protein kinase [Sesamum angolense]